MASSTIKVWLPEPDSVELMGGLPAGMTVDVWTGGEQLPDSADEVEVVVLPFGVPPSRMPVLSKLPRLRLIQLMSAGAENAIPFVPAGVTLCNARGVHDPAVAEWVMAVVLAQVRQLPKFVIAQQAGSWDPVRSESLAGQTVLIVGYGSIGEAVERMLAPFGVTVERIARHARPGVSGMDDLPAALPRADIVILLVPVTRPPPGWWTRGSWPRCMITPCWSTRPAARSWTPTRCSPSYGPGGCVRPWMSPTLSRSRPGIRSGPRTACCSRPMWPAR